LDTELSSLDQFFDEEGITLVYLAVLGLGVGVMLHFVLYRIGRPIQPFIYQAF
jgi:hypothetical protein